jgi:hypothetical protein
VSSSHHSGSAQYCWPPGKDFEMWIITNCSPSYKPIQSQTVDSKMWIYLSLTNFEFFKLKSRGATGNKTRPILEEINQLHE